MLAVRKFILQPSYTHAPLPPTSMHRYNNYSLFPAPSPHVGKDLVTLEWYLCCLWSETVDCNVKQSITCLSVCCCATGCKIIELQSDWLVWKQDCWACKNQENTQMFPDPYSHRGQGLGTRQIGIGIWLCLVMKYEHIIVTSHDTKLFTHTWGCSCHFIILSLSLLSHCLCDLLLSMCMLFSLQWSLPLSQ